MEIHILRDGKQIGPFSEETVQSLLKQGNILINDLAWSPGLDGWSPLHAVLYPAAQPPPVPANATPPPMPPAAEPESVEMEMDAVVDPIPGPSADSVREERATQRQKAFLQFMGISFGPDLGKDRAAHLVNDAMENPKNSGKLKRWDEERFRLYPDLFADEIKARRENRSQQFLEICEGEGAEFFEGVTKAHTQVLVGYLDVQYPTWEQTDHSAKYDYFFPAIAEKFPQLVKRSAKGRFKYPDGPKVAAELRRGPAMVRAKPGKSPVKAVIRGILIGAIMLGVGVGAFELKERGGFEAVKNAIAKLSEKSKTAPTKPAAGKSTSTPATPAPIVSSASESEIPPPPPPPVFPVTPGETAPPLTVAQATPSTPATPSTQPGASAPGATVAPSPAPAADSTMAPAPAPGLPTNVSLFDTTPPPAVPPPAPDSPASAPAATPAPAPAPAAAQRVFAKITKPTVINLRFGTSTLRPGTPVQVLSSSGANLTIKFGPDTATVPVANTDYGTDVSMAPAPTSQ